MLVQANAGEDAESIRTLFDELSREGMSKVESRLEDLVEPAVGGVERLLCEELGQEGVFC